MSRTEKLLTICGIVLFFLLNYPLLKIFNMETPVLGIPLATFYLFSVWMVALVCLVLFGHRLRSRRGPEL